MTSVTPADHNGLLAFFAVMTFGTKNEHTRQLIAYPSGAHE